jgi:hypothetical protein
MNDIVTWILTAPYALVVGGFEAWIVTTSILQTRRARANFIAAGCPPDFTIPPHNWARYRYSQALSANPNSSFNRALRRAKRLRRSRTMPADWKPHSRIERALRPFRDKFYRAWYPWLYDDEPGG